MPYSARYTSVTQRSPVRFLIRPHTVGIAAIALGTSVLLSRLMGLVRDKIISFYFGASPEADVYFMAFVVPDYINYLLAGGYFSITLVPLLTSAFHDNEDNGWKFFSTSVCWAFFSIALLTVIAMIYAKPIAHFIAPGFSEANIERLCIFLRIILPAQICFLPGACFTAMLYLRKHFTAPAITPLIYNGCTILVGLIFLTLFPERGMEGFCWGVLCGAFLGSFLLPVLAVRAGGLRFRLSLRHPLMKRVLILALPLMFGQSIVVLDEQFVRIFGTLTGEGNVSLLNYARRIMLVPVGVIAQAAGLASYPFLASLLANNEMGKFNNHMRSTLTTTLLVAIPVSLWVITISEPVMRLIFQQGSFTTANAQSAGLLLTIMMSSVVFWCVQQVLGRGFYANQDMLTPAVCGTLATLASLPFYWFGAQYFGAVGVATAGCCAIALYTVVLWFRWLKKFGKSATTTVIQDSLKTLALCLPAAAGSWYISHLIGLATSPSSLGAAFWRIASSGLTFAVLYFALFALCAPRLSQPITSMLFLFLRKARLVK